MEFAAREALLRSRPGELLDAIAWSEARFRQEGDFEATALIRRERDGLNR